MKLGTYNKPANQQSNWHTLNSFWKEFGQYHAPPPPECKPFDAQVLDNVADNYRDNSLTMLSRDFNHQERCYAQLAKRERWEAVRAPKKPRRLRVGIHIKKRKAIDSYFRAIRDTNVVMLFSNESFLPPSRERDSVSTGSQKAFHEKFWGAQIKQGLPLLPEERSCASDGGWKGTGEQYIAGTA